MQTPAQTLHAAATSRNSGGNRPRPQRGGGRGGNGFARRDAPASQGKRVTFPWINGQIIAAADTEDLGHLLATIEAHLQQMNLVNLSTALHRLAKLAGSSRVHHHQAKLQQTLPTLLATVKAALLRSEATGSVPRCQALSNITWALATMQVVDAELVQMVAPRAHSQLADFKNFELCQLLWAFAKLGTVDPRLCDSIAPLFTSASQFVIRHIEDFTFRGLVMTCWAFATAKQHDPRLFRSIAARLIPMAYGANCQELANTAWAFSTAGVQEDRLFATLAAVAIPHIQEFKPQELSSILWSFASIGHSNDDFYQAAGRTAMQMQLQAQQLANILWALTKMRPHHESTKEALLRLLPWCTALCETFKTQELASVALAASKCFGTIPGSQEKPQSVPPQVIHFFNAALPMAVPSLREYSGQSLANIASSVLAVRVGATSGLFDAVGYEVMSRAESLENSALLLLLRTFPHAPQSAAVHSALCQLFAEAARRIEQLPARELQVLARICARPFGAIDIAVNGPPGNFQHSESREELRVWCLTLATKWRSGDIIPGEAQERVQEEMPRAPNVHASDPANEAKIDAEDAEAQEDISASFDRWAPTLTIANTGRASAWDEKAMEKMRHALEKSEARREEVARERVSADGPPVAEATAWVSPSREEPAARQPHIVYSVKNTFLDVEDGNDDEGSDSELMNMPLPPALPFIPESVSAEKLQAYRANYARFRVGNALGAKGELDTCS